jgi:hypothetical protein
VIRARGSASAGDVDTAKAPARPAVAAATRSTSVGDARPVICELFQVEWSSGSTTATSAASPTTAAIAATTIPTDADLVVRAERASQRATRRHTATVTGVRVTFPHPCG